MRIFKTRNDKMDKPERLSIRQNLTAHEKRDRIIYNQAHAEYEAYLPNRKEIHNIVMKSGTIKSPCKSNNLYLTYKQAQEISTAIAKRIEKGE